MKRLKSPFRKKENLWKSKFLFQNLFHDIFNYFLGLPCHLIAVDHPETWHIMTNVVSKPSPLDYENAQDHWNDRIRYNQKAFQKVIRGQKPVCFPYQGLYGLFVPLVEQKKCKAILQAGVFLKNLPAESDLIRQWKRLTGRNPKTRDQDFLGYARTVLETPVFNEKVLRALQEIMELYAGLLAGTQDWEKAYQRMNELRRLVFARELWHRFWVDWVALQKKFFRPPQYAGRLLEWEKEELGLTRFPTTLLAVKRESTGREFSDLFAAGQLQREAFQAAHELEESIAYPLRHYGSVVLTSAKPGQSPALEKLEIRGKAEALARRLSEKFKCRILIGVGRTSPRGAELNESYHEAVAALHLAETQNRPLVFYGDLIEKPNPESSLRRSPAGLIRSLSEEGNERSGAHRRRFVEAVLMGTRGKPEGTRRYFLEALHRLMEQLEERKAIEAPVLADLGAEIEDRLESAPSLNEMVERFEGALESLIPFLTRPAAGEKMIRLHRAQETVEGSLQKPWTLPVIARQFGFSNSVFSREFTRFAGSPFSEFLLTQRLEKARRLLLDTTLPLSPISEACGFQSTNYFLQVFKRKTGKSPNKYRQNPNA